MQNATPATPRMANDALARRIVMALVVSILATLLSVSGVIASETGSKGPDITGLTLDRDGADVGEPVSEGQFQIQGNPSIVLPSIQYLAGPHDVAGGNEGLSYPMFAVMDHYASLFDVCAIDATLRLSHECR